jgi:ABC-2 type transport system permease protein
MNKFWIIAFHTYKTKLKTKSFIFTTIISALFFVGFANFQSIIDFFNKDDEKKTIAVIDETGTIYDLYAKYVTSDQIILKPFNGTEEEAKEKTTSGKFTGYIMISLDEQRLPKAVYKAMSITDSEINDALERALQQVKTEMATAKIGLTQEQVQQLYEPVSFEKMALEKDAKSEEELNQARGLVYVLLFVIYFAVIMYANMIAMEVATEKSSRVMEILISSVSPIQQMFAKIIGVALLSLTQVGVILTIGYTSIKSMTDQKEGFYQFFGFSEVPFSTFVYAVIFFLLGYFLFATLAAFLGSLVSRIEDVQQMIVPMTLLVVAAFMIAMFGLGKPEAPFITVMSFIPFFAPMIMFLRVGMLNVPFWEIALSIALLLLTIFVLAIFGAKVYRGGVLLYGKSSSFKDIKKALSLLKK